IIGAGTGLLVKNKKLSTDQIEFIGSIGVIAKQISVLRKVMENLLEMPLFPSQRKKIRIAIPMRGSVKTPDGMDMYEKVKSNLDSINCSDYELIEVEMNGISDRTIGIELIDRCFYEHQVDLILTC